MAEAIKPRKKRRGVDIDFVDRAKYIRSSFSRNDDFVQPFSALPTLVLSMKQESCQAIVERKQDAIATYKQPLLDGQALVHSKRLNGDDKVEFFRGLTPINIAKYLR